MRKRQRFRGKKGIKELAVKESVTHYDSVTASARDTLQQKKGNLQLRTDAILLWWIGTRASLQSFGGEKSPNWKCNLHFILFSDIQHKSNASPWLARFNAIYMQPHTSLQGFRRETKSYWHPPSPLRFAGVPSNASEGHFLGKWSEGFNFVQFIEYAPKVTFWETTGHH